MNKVLVTDSVHPLLIEGLLRRNFEVDYQPQITLAQVHAKIHAYIGIIINTKTVVDKTLIDRAEQLQFVGRLGSGLEIINLEYAKTKNIYCFNTPEGNRNAVAEHALALVLNLFNNINKSNNQVKEFSWLREENRGLELDGKTIGIIGLGNTGKAFARKLQGFDVEILAYDIEEKEFNLAEQTSLDKIYKRVDVLSIHLPLNQTTHHWLNQARIESFSKPIYIINTSRGKIINQVDLLKNLQNGKILGAGLDVLENEKIDVLNGQERQVLAQLNFLNNVIITPHIAGWTHESKRKIAENILNKIDLYMKL